MLYIKILHHIHVLTAQLVHLVAGAGTDYSNLCRLFQNFGRKHCLRQILAPANSAMVGQQHSLFAVQRTHGVLRQLLRTAESVLGALHPAADNLHDILDNSRYSLMHSRKRTGINTVRMDYGTCLGIGVVNSGVHLQFGGRNPRTVYNVAITVDNDNVLWRQRFLTMAGGCDSNILRVNTAADVAPRACDELFFNQCMACFHNGGTCTFFSK